MVFCSAIIDFGDILAKNSSEDRVVSERGFSMSYVIFLIHVIQSTSMALIEQTSVVIIFGKYRHYNFSMPSHKKNVSLSQVVSSA